MHGGGERESDGAEETDGSSALAGADGTVVQMNMTCIVITHGASRLSDAHVDKGH